MDVSRAVKKELSIFIDESGDFGAYSPHAPYYIVPLVLHDQRMPLRPLIAKLNDCAARAGFQNHAIHTGPLIRREADYANMTIKERKYLFNALFHFVRNAPILYTSIVIDKSMCGDTLSDKLSQGIEAEILRYHDYFALFDEIIVYYDNGQNELNGILTSVFRKWFSNISFRTVKPVDYKLFQAADFICTLELLYRKAEKKCLSRSETRFFESAKAFRKSYYRAILRKHL